VPGTNDKRFVAIIIAVPAFRAVERKYH